SSKNLYSNKNYSINKLALELGISGVTCNLFKESAFLSVIAIKALNRQAKMQQPHKRHTPKL
ncbi:MAG: hypothetical protein WC325_12235, partial [Candidatus Bathyarchaeia archaeon]